MSTYAEVKVFLWHPEWDCDAVEVLSEGWPKDVNPLPLHPTPRDAEVFAQNVHEATGLCCTVENVTKVTYP